jgi:diketogulonate reductase-like aldo/keto reductase
MGAMTIPSAPLGGPLAMPLLGFGTWQIRGDAAYEAVREALEAGYRHLDTATMYGNEAEVGRAIADSGLRPEELFVTTKLPPDRAGRERETIAASLDALRLDRVDLWLVHWPTPDRLLVPTWERLLALRDQGITAAVGVSNYSLAQIDRLTSATGEAPAVNQISWAPSRFDAQVLAGSRRRGVVVEGYSAFKNTDLRDPRLVAIARRHQVTTAQVVLRWHVQHEVVAIPKSVTPARIVENLDVFGFELSAEEMRTIDAFGR